MARVLLTRVGIRPPAEEKRACASKKYIKFGAINNMRTECIVARGFMGFTVINLRDKKYILRARNTLSAALARSLG